MAAGTETVLPSGKVMDVACAVFGGKLAGALFRAAAAFPQQCLYFLPLPQGQGRLRDSARMFNGLRTIFPT